ncbi:hypothetical protein C3B79_0121 [Aeromonas hydrophila]|nr:hypothetical protein C3B79_0121 [Aeromonas hydrophila]
MARISQSDAIAITIAIITITTNNRAALVGGSWYQLWMAESSFY